MPRTPIDMRQMIICDGIKPGLEVPGVDQPSLWFDDGQVKVQQSLSLWSGQLTVRDDLLLRLGNDGDQVMVNRTAILNTNTVLTGVLVGTPVTPAVAANSLILSGITASGDILIAANLAGNSQAWLWVDSSASLLTLYAAGVSALEIGAAGVVFNEASADRDLRVESNDNANMLVVDAGTDSAALGRAVVAGAFLSVDGSAVNRAGVTSVGRHVHIPAATITQTNANPTTLAVGAGMYLGAPTFAGANASQTITDAASLYVVAPVQGTNMTLTRNWTAVFGGRVGIGSDPTAIVHDLNSATAVVFNQPGSDIDFRVESVASQYMIVVDANKDALVLGSNTDTASVDQLITVSRAARTATTTVNYYDLIIAPAGPVTVPTGTTAIVATARFDEPNITATGTVTAATTVHISGAPTEGGSNYALWVDAGATRLDGNLDMSDSGLDIVVKAATAAAIEISDGTTKFYAFDTRVATAGVTTHALDISDYTIASAAGNVATGLSLAAHTLNYTGTTQVTTQVDTVVIGARTIAGDTATLTVNESNTLLLVAPTEGTNVVITAASALRIVDAGGTPTNQYGIYIETLTAGATADYAIWVAGANAVHLGTAGTATGLLEIDGATSGTMTLTVPAATTSYTLTLPAAANANAGYQLTCAGADTLTSWGAAGSVREIKDIQGKHDAQDALDKILAARVYDFHYKDGKGTQDSKTDYVGLMADEAPWAMHYAGGVVNPVNTLGYTVLAFQAMADRINRLEAKLASIGA